MRWFAISTSTISFHLSDGMTNVGAAGDDVGESNPRLVRLEAGLDPRDPDKAGAGEPRSRECFPRAVGREG